MADTSKQSTYRQKKTQGLGDRFSINPLYNTSAILKAATDKIFKAMDGDQPKKPKK